METKVMNFASEKSGKILKWKVREGMVISHGTVVFVYKLCSGKAKDVEQKFKATEVGIVKTLLAKEGAVILPGAAILELKQCTHPTVMKDMCAECGMDLRMDENAVLSASVPMIHSIPELKVSEEQAQILGKVDEKRLLEDSKLVLLVDLDQTLIHTTNDNIPAELKDVYHFQLYGPQSPWYHTRIRPGTRRFLSEMSQIYELHICTFGARNYAHMIATFLDPSGKYFSHRILSRDECFNPVSKKANLKALFPCGENLVCIIDDREDVWNNSPNLIHVKPYHFFKHTGDINAPPGLAKRENDDKEGFDFSRIDGKKSRKKVTKSDVKKKKPVEDREEGELSDQSAKSSSDTPNSSTKEVDLKKEQDVEDKSDPSAKVELNFTSETQEVTKQLGNACSVKSVSSDKSVTNSVAKDSEEKVDCEGREKINSENLGIKGEEDVKQDAAEVEMKNDKNSVPIPLKNTEDIDKCEENAVDIPVGSEDTKVGEEKKEIEGNEGNENKDTTDNTASKSSDCKFVNIIEVVNKLDEEKLGDKSEGIEIEDNDDYLMYLEDILKNIHSAFYKMYDKSKTEIPDLKDIIPSVRQGILKNLHLVFSGLVPTSVPLENSRAYLVARSLGAVVSPNFTDQTTHLVAAQPGTAKVNAARKKKKIKTVTADWLWSCAERWEYVDERLFPLNRKGCAKRNPPAHCTSPEHCSAQLHPNSEDMKQSNENFIESINPLMSFSSEDIARMDKEVQDICDESDESDSDSEEESDKPPPIILSKGDDESSSSSADSLSGEFPHGWSSQKENLSKRIHRTEDEDDDDEESPVVKFRRGEDLPSDTELNPENSENSNSGTDEDLDEMDDGEWNMMGAALEREFLSD